MKPINKRQLNVFIWRLSKHMVFQNHCSIQVTPLREQRVSFSLERLRFLLSSKLRVSKGPLLVCLSSDFHWRIAWLLFFQKVHPCQILFLESEWCKSWENREHYFSGETKWKGNWRKKKFYIFFKQLLNVTGKCLAFVYKSIACL